jgi:hypothetical protein
MQHYTGKVVSVLAGAAVVLSLALSGRVLCVGPDDHVAIEMPHTDGGCPASGHSDDDEHGAPASEDCQDVKLGPLVQELPAKHVKLDLPTLSLPLVFVTVLPRSQAVAAFWDPEDTPLSDGSLYCIHTIVLLV